MDNRNKNNQSLAQRRQAVYRRRRKLPAKARADILAKAKQVLRRTGKAVYDAKIDAPKFRGYVIVDARKLSPDDVIRMATEILEAEGRRNNELRAQHGLELRKIMTLEEM